MPLLWSTFVDEEVPKPDASEFFSSSYFFWFTVDSAYSTMNSAISTVIMSA